MAPKYLHGRFLTVSLSVTLFFCLCNRAPAAPRSSREQQQNHEPDVTHKWQQMARTNLERQFSNAKDKSVIAKNVILFIGDGMSLGTITAARILKGQLDGDDADLEQNKEPYQAAEDGQLSFESFHHIALSKTYNLDSQVGDSGACATALMSGVKANFETIGLSGRAQHDNCSSTFLPGARVSSIAEWAQQQGKSTGFVTTTRVTHATPAAFYAHSANRYWESDDKVPPEATMCKDIARQLIEDEPGRNLNVIMGGGSRHFLDSSKAGKRLDGKNLINAWMEDKDKRGLLRGYVSNRKELFDQNTSKMDYLLGLFASNHMAHEADRNKSAYGEPSLAEMAVSAIQVLKHNPNGFLLLVESGRIDHAHHLNNAYRALTDTLALDAAVQQVLGHVNLSTTLLIVTADHSTVFTFGGFPQRGNSILGLDGQLSDRDKLPYTTLLYGNGPGHRANRPNLTYTSTESKEYIQQAAVPRRWATHGGEDVPVYAAGAGADVFRGVLDQTFIPYGISYAANMGPMKSLREDHIRRWQMLTRHGKCLTEESRVTSDRSRARDDPMKEHIDQLILSSQPDRHDQELTLLDYIRYQWHLASSTASSHPPQSVFTLLFIVTWAIYICSI